MIGFSRLVVLNFTFNNSNEQEYQLDENEERSMIEPKSYENPKLQELIRVLLDWINDELHTERIIVQDVEEDLYDGQVFFEA